MTTQLRNEDVVVESTPLTVKLASFFKGEMTWAEVEGMTQSQAASIAEKACELSAAGNHDGAFVILDGLVAMNPKDSAAWAALGTVEQKREKFDAAKKAYDAAIALDPKSAVALANRGELRLSQGDSEGVQDLAAAVAADEACVTKAAMRARALLVALTQFANQAS